MKIVPALVWRQESAAGAPLDPRLLPLLKAIAATESLAGAVAQCGISYRAGWGLLRDCQRALGVPLAELARGRGARLTAPAERLLAADAEAARRLARALPALAVDFNPAARERSRPSVGSLGVAASHDLALAALAPELPGVGGLALELSFMGSLHALKELADGRVDVAGFHLPITARIRWDHSAFLQGLQARRHRLIRFVDRDQGLILPAGNPRQARRLADVARLRLRFVNRQRGSGTRLLVDQMLAHERIAPGAIDGYGREEFTHPAVAATVASGGADAGFGLRAAAAEYRLAFVPLVRERYFLALRAKDVDGAAAARLIEVLRGPVFARIVRGLPGYRSAGAGEVLTLDATGATGAVRSPSGK